MVTRWTMALLSTRRALLAKPQTNEELGAKMGNLVKRLDALEKRAKGPGALVVFYDDLDQSEAENEAGYQQALADAGPDGTVIRVQYVRDWRGSDGAGGAVI